MQALRAFEAAARLGSLTRAAAELSVTHGAISHQVKALEDDLGVELMVRAGRGVRVTEAGERFALRVRDALDRLAEAVRETTAHVDEQRIRVTVVPSFAARWLLPRIGRFVAGHPDVDIDVRANPAMVDFAREDIDFGIRHGVGGWPDVIAEHLFDETYFPVCSPRIANGRLPARPADLRDYVLLRGEGEPWVPWFRAAGLDWPEPLRGPMFSDSSHVAQAAAEGQGIALARESLLGNDLRTGALVRLFDVRVPSPRRFFLVYPPRLAKSGKLAAFRAWLRGEIADDDTLGAGLATAAPPAQRGAPAVKRRGTRATARR
jgi:LysR family glycine cleavage system transcriptional activator